jgi:acetolactate synthase-1/2/3 large subunit
MLNSKITQLDHKEWVEEVMERKNSFPLKYRVKDLTGPYIIEMIDKITGGDAIISTDVGQHQMWSAQYFKYRNPRNFLTSGGMGTMGYGLGACIGAKTAFPDKTVINIAGDGCFRMNMNELATATRHEIPIIQVVLNNHALGMVRQWQTLFYEKRYSHTVLNDKVDFVKVAEAMGAKAYRVTKREEVESVIQEAIALKQTVLLDCIIHNDDKVWPMVAPGAAISEVFSEEDLE